MTVTIFCGVVCVRSNLSKPCSVPKLLLCVSNLFDLLQILLLLIGEIGEVSEVGEVGQKEKVKRRRRLPKLGTMLVLHLVQKVSWTSYSHTT